MHKMKRKLISIFMAGIIAVSFSLSAVAEEAFVDEVVAEAVVDIDNVCTEDHDHDSFDKANMSDIIIARACAHSGMGIPSSTSTVQGEHKLANGSYCKTVTTYNHTNRIACSRCSVILSETVTFVGITHSVSH